MRMGTESVSSKFLSLEIHNDRLYSSNDKQKQEMPTDLTDRFVHPLPTINSFYSSH